MWSEHRLISFDETPLFYHRCLLKEAPRAVILIAHGMGEHGGRYRALAEYLAGFGFESFIPDLRGFGRSGGARACVRRFSDFHKDLEVFHSFISRTHPEAPIFFLGHSFGGLVTSSYLAFYSKIRTKGLILSSPIFGIAMPVPLWRSLLGIAASYFLPDYTQPSGVMPATLTHDLVMLEAYAKDGMIYHRISARLYRELLFMISKNKRIAESLTCPVLLLQSGQDKVVSEQAALGFYDHLATRDKELEVYPDFYHEILNEVDRERVFIRIGQWISTHML